MVSTIVIMLDIFYYYLDNEPQSATQYRLSMFWGFVEENVLQMNVCKIAVVFVEGWMS